jgi:hypothetical protein
MGSYDLGLQHLRWSDRRGHRRLGDRHGGRQRLADGPERLRSSPPGLGEGAVVDLKLANGPQPERSACLLMGIDRPRGVVPRGPI